MYRRVRHAVLPVFQGLTIAATELDGHVPL